MARGTVTFRATGDAALRLAGMADRAHGNLGPRIAKAAQRLAPIETGELRASIGYVEARKFGKPVLYITAGSDSQAPYAAYVELGTERMRAQPYLRPAVFRKWL